MPDPPRPAGTITSTETRRHRAARARTAITTLTILAMGLGMQGALAIEAAMPARELRATHDALRVQLDENQFGRPLYLRSQDTSRALQGEIYAVLDYPFPTVDTVLSDPQVWCDIFTLHINVKYCHAARGAAGTVLTVDLGKKYDQPLADTFRIAFSYAKKATPPNYFASALVAERGPLSTRDYHLEFEAIPLDEGHTFLHLTYAYSFGLGGRLAMHGYLATVARDKVGFTIAARTSAGAPIYIQGLRGVIERNTMRYGLAIDAYLASLSAAPADRFETRLRYWFDSTEQYAVQLHEMDREQYLALKRRELARELDTH